MKKKNQLGWLRTSLVEHRPGAERESAMFLPPAHLFLQVRTGPWSSSRILDLKGLPWSYEVFIVPGPDTLQ